MRRAAWRAIGAVGCQRKDPLDVGAVQRLARIVGPFQRLPPAPRDSTRPQCSGHDPVRLPVGAEQEWLLTPPPKLVFLVKRDRTRILLPHA